MSDSRYSRCLVTGAAGFMGSQMVEFLASRGFVVVATDITDEPPGLPRGVRYLKADLTVPESLAPAVEGVEVIFNPASIFDFSTPWPVMRSVNVDGTRNLCEAACRAGVRRMVHWSTMMIFGYTSSRSTPIDENTPRMSNSVYARSKILQEDVVIGYSKGGRLPATVIRPSIVYGAGSRYGFADMCFKFKRLGFVPALTALKKRICMVHSKDVVAAAHHLSLLPEAAGECYNITDDTTLPMRDMFTAMALVLGLPAVPLPFPERAVRHLAAFLAELCSRHSWMSVGGAPIIEKDFVHLLDMDGYATNAKLRASGYEPLYPDWRTGIVEVSRWYKERGLW